MNITDLLGAISYAFRMEVPVHQIMSGDTFTALLRFVHLLESVSYSTSLSSFTGLVPPTFKSPSLLIKTAMCVCAQNILQLSSFPGLLFHTVGNKRGASLVTYTSSIKDNKSDPHLGVGFGSGTKTGWQPGNESGWVSGNETG